MTGIPYYDTVTFAHFFFEDSYVLAIHVFPGKIVFEVDAVLTESHPRYTAPAEDEQYCFRSIEIVFDNVKSIFGFSLQYIVCIDIDDEKDMGNIDSLTIDGGNIFSISGPWGNVDLLADSVSVNLV